MELLYILLVLLLATRLAGELAIRMGQPAMTGELVAGVLIGIVVHQYGGAFPVLAELTENEVFIALTDLAVFFLMLSAGIEMHPKELAEGSRKSFSIAVGGMAVPLAAGVGLGWYYLPASDYRAGQIMFLGTALAITAVPVAVRVLMDLGKLDSRPGRLIVSAAIFDDVLSLILLAVLTALIQTGSLPDWAGLGMLAGKVLLFFVVAIAAGKFVLPWLLNKIRHFWIEELEFSALLIVALGFSVLAELLDLHFILGAFFAGLFFTGRVLDPKVYRDVRQKINGVTTGFLAPLFFASIGLHLQIGAVTAVPMFLFLLIAFAFLAKGLGAAVPAYASGLNSKESALVGSGMCARGAVELVIADIALRAGLFTHPDPPPPIVANMFSAVVIMAIITTLAAPIIMKLLLKAHDKDESGRGGVEENASEAEDAS